MLDSFVQLDYLVNIPGDEVSAIFQQVRLPGDIPCQPFAALKGPSRVCSEAAHVFSNSEASRHMLTYTYVIAEACLILLRKPYAHLGTVIARV